MNKKYLPIPASKDSSSSRYEVTGDLKNYRLKADTNPIIGHCPYCARSTGGDSNLVILDGMTYSACAMGSGCNADEPSTWGAYFAGSLYYDIPFMVLAIMVILPAHFIFSPYANDPMLAEIVVVLKIIIYASMSLVFPLGLVFSIGFPVPFLTLIFMPLYSWWMIYG